MDFVRLRVSQLQDIYFFIMIEMKSGILFFYSDSLIK